MSKLFLVIKREYLERVRSRWFLIGTLLGPVFMSGLILAPLLIARYSAAEQHIAIVNAANDAQLSTLIEEKLSKKKPAGKFKIKQQAVTDPAQLTTVEQQLSKDVESGTLNGYLVLKPESVKSGAVDYFAKNVSDFVGLSQIEDATNAAIVERRLSSAGIDPARIAELSRPIELKRNRIVATGAQEDKGQSFFLAYILMLIIYMTTVLYGVAVLRGVMEEKQSRIVEVIVSSISPMELMFGKLIGIGLVGLTQFTFWSICAALLPTAFAAMSFAAGSTFPEIPITLLVYFVIFFVLGYFLYSTLYAMAGSIISSEQDSNSVQMPITMLLVVAVMFASLILQNPNSNAAVGLSMVPFFAPILMFLRITVQTPPFWQIALSIVIMLITIVACSWISAKIYRVGILMYGKRPTLPELVRWLKYT